jgi:hypothetical protein
VTSDISIFGNTSRLGEWRHVHHNRRRLALPNSGSSFAYMHETRRIIHAAHMLLVDGKVQREGQVVHFVFEELTDLFAELAAIGEDCGPSRYHMGMGMSFIMPVEVRFLGSAEVPDQG